MSECDYHHVPSMAGLDTRSFQLPEFTQLTIPGLNLGEVINGRLYDTDFRVHDHLIGLLESNLVSPECAFDPNNPNPVTIRPGGDSPILLTKHIENSAKTVELEERFSNAAKIQLAAIRVSRANALTFADQGNTIAEYNGFVARGVSNSLAQSVKPAARAFAERIFVVVDEDRKIVGAGLDLTNNTRAAARNLIYRLSAEKIARTGLAS